MARILVVDDEPHVVELISTVLRLEGHKIETASDGREALERIEARIPELIVLDLAMPEMDGWKLLEELHARGLRRKTRVVIVSANLTDGARGRGERSRVRHFLEKPFEIESLLALVNDALAQDADELYVKREHSGDLARLIQKVDEVLR